MNAQRGASNPPRVAELQLNEQRGELKIRLSDGGEFALAPDAPEARGLSPGIVVSAAQRAELEEAAVRKQIARHAMRLLDRRAYPRSALRRKLLESTDRVQAVDAVLGACEDQGLIDDRQYARAWCAHQLRRKAVGRRWLRRGLLNLGVADGHATAALDAVLPRDAELAQAARALRRRADDLSAAKHKARALRFLLGRGFDRGTAMGVIAQQLAARGAEPVSGRAEEDEHGVDGS